MSFKIGILDDELIYREQATNIISDFMKKREKAYYIYVFQEEEEYENFINESNIELDILFLDIELITCSGIDIAKKTNSERPWCQIVYLTNYLHYFTDVYASRHCYFILKSEFESRISDVMDKIERELSFVYERKLILTLRGKKEILDQKDICYIERSRHSTFIKTAHSTITVSEN